MKQGSLYISNHPVLSCPGIQQLQFRSLIAYKYRLCMGGRGAVMRQGCCHELLSLFTSNTSERLIAWLTPIRTKEP